ncbi:Uroporphyrinogen III synthase HEM4 [Methanocaldococcus vulcanius M7]|uniref:Uroporphyrinogen-III synthase n=1 Tax=Methanocaldococcus vulcanius (strain ATCC 700851 / DSM 12094 / M7) TaxID=579137 RepID=C9RF91_METVM|nr:uroporphyrinogen-III synthase [Methanocaldococcus vulcanius]ACX72243.1 Uroporphyrinogen III synthase HEM4 [Methanocaldococcus vulcanius M7]
MKVVITRPKERAEAFSTILKKENFDPIIFPTLKLEYNKDLKIDLDEYGWIIFTSPSGVIGLNNILSEKEKENVKDKKIAAIGEKTAKMVKKIFGKYPDIVPKQYTAECLLEEIKKRADKNDRFLVPTTPSTRDILKNNLNADLVFVYKSVEPENLKENMEVLKETLKNEERFIITFTSGLTAKNFFKYVDDEFYQMIKNNYIVAIGPITAKVIQKFGINPKIPDKYTIEGMLEVIKSIRRENNI